MESMETIIKKFNNAPLVARNGLQGVAARTNSVSEYLSREIVEHKRQKKQFEHILKSSKSALGIEHAAIGMSPDISSYINSENNIILRLEDDLNKSRYLEGTFPEIDLGFLDTLRSTPFNITVRGNEYAVRLPIFAEYSIRQPDVNISLTFMTKITSEHVTLDESALRRFLHVFRSADFRSADITYNSTTTVDAQNFQSRRKLDVRMDLVSDPSRSKPQEEETYFHTIFKGRLPKSAREKILQAQHDFNYVSIIAEANWVEGKSDLQKQRDARPVYDPIIVGSHSYCSISDEDVGPKMTHDYLIGTFDTTPLEKHFVNDASGVRPGRN